MKRKVLTASSYTVSFAKSQTISELNDYCNKVDNTEIVFDDVPPAKLFSYLGYIVVDSEE